METLDVIIVGAGISGILAARELRRGGLDVVLLEKGRGVGGRMATRRLDNAVFDHGAQFFTARDEAFRSVVLELERNGVAACWYDERPDGRRERHYRGVPAMTAVAKALSRGLEVRLGTRATSIRLRPPQDGAVVTLEDGVELAAKRVVLSSPVPQSLTLCSAGGLEVPVEARHLLERIEYEPCFALMVVMSEGGTDLPEPGYVRPGRGPIAWMADNRRKGVSPHAPCVTIHATDAFSTAHFDAPPDEVTAMLLAAAGTWLPGEVLKTSLQRWRYSKPRAVHERRFFGVPGFPIVFCGDAFGGPRVEGAALSGLAAGGWVLRDLSLR